MTASSPIPRCSFALAEKCTHSYARYHVEKAEAAHSRPVRFWPGRCVRLSLPSRVKRRRAMSAALELGSRA